MYSVKAVKSFESPDGGGFNCTLLEDGKPVAQCHDSGDGGDVDFRWLDKTAEARLEQYCAALPKTDPDEYGMELTWDPGFFVSDLVARYLDDKRFERMSRTKYLFRVEGDPAGEWRTIKRCPEALLQITRRYGDAVVIWEPAC